MIGDKKVIIVEWQYRGPSARAAIAALRADPDVNQGPPDLNPRYSKDVQGGWLAGWVDDAQTAVRVVFQMK